MRRLTEKELCKMSKYELKIMRNEIFARYGYKFIEGGTMDKYFSHKDWYRGDYDNVDDFLTPIEKHNINLIQKCEKKQV